MKSVGYLCRTGQSLRKNQKNRMHRGARVKGHPISIPPGDPLSCIRFVPLATRGIPFTPVWLQHGWAGCAGVQRKRKRWQLSITIHVAMRMCPAGTRKISKPVTWESLKQYFPSVQTRTDIIDVEKSPYFKDGLYPMHTSADSVLSYIALSHKTI